MTPEITEEWRPVPIAEFSSFYEVSNTGRVRSLDRMSRTKGDAVFQRLGVEMKLRVNARGYPCAYLRAGKLEKNATVHRLVAGAFISNPTNLPEVNHLDTVKTNNVWTNLEWTDRLGNHSHAVKAGIQSVAIRKLSDDDVREIRAMVKSGHTTRDIGTMFGINPGTVSKIANGLRRVHRVRPRPAAA